MSLTKFTESTNIISELDDQPSLTATELKAKFDEVGGKIKTYLNNILTTETEQLVATEKSVLQGLITALGTQIRAEISTSLRARYHIGKIIIETENINPATYLGFGTWELWGQGKVPVGVDTEDEDFNTVEKTGGEKEHQLIQNELPEVVVAGAYNVIGEGWTLGNGGTPQLYTTGNNTIGDNQPHNILQPYITCYMWKRVN